MTNDLLSKIEKVIASCRSDDHNLICEVYQALKQQQAEINRLKSGQVQWRPFSELKTLKEITSIITIHQNRWPSGYAEPMYTNIGAYYPEDNRVRDTSGDKVSSNNILFFIEIPDLPTEIEVTA